MKTLKIGKEMSDRVLFKMWRQVSYSLLGIVENQVWDGILDPAMDMTDQVEDETWSRVAIQVMDQLENPFL